MKGRREDWEKKKNLPLRHREHKGEEEKKRLCEMKKRKAEERE